MPASTGPLHAANFRLVFASIAGWVGAGIGVLTYLVVGAIWIVVTTVIVVSVRDVRDFQLEPSLQEPELAASAPAS